MQDKKVLNGLESGKDSGNDNGSNGNSGNDNSDGYSNPYGNNGDDQTSPFDSDEWPWNLFR